MNYSEQLEFAKRTAISAGGLLLNSLGSGMQNETADDGYHGVVNSGDIRSDEFIRQAIEKSYPDYGVVTEEVKARKSGDPLWIVDPRDGTNNANRGFHFYSVSIGLREDEKGVVGVVYAPALGKLYYASRGGGAFLEYDNGKKRGLSITDEQRDYSRRMFTPSIATVTDLTDRDKWSEVIGRIQSSGLVKTMCRRMLESTALEMCGIAEGWVDAHFNNFPCVWDWAAGEVIVKEAGGEVTYMPNLGKHGTLVASNGTFHDGLVRIVKEVFGV